MSFYVDFQSTANLYEMNKTTGGGSKMSAPQLQQTHFLSVLIKKVVS